MSRGLGKTQKAILDMLSDGEWHWIDDLSEEIYSLEWEAFLETLHSLGQEISRMYSYQMATIRAAKRLQAMEQVEFETALPKLVYQREGPHFGECHRQRARLQRAKLSVGHGGQHLELRASKC